MLDRITPLILTFDEAPNIERTLSRLGWAKRIVVVDSGSADGTLDIIARYPRVEVFHRTFDDFASQCNFALNEAGMTTEWVLSLDADYVLSDQLVKEIGRISPATDVAGYRASFRYCIMGHAIRAGVYPPVVVLFRRNGAAFVKDGHAHRIVVEGRVEELVGTIDHDDRKPLSRWLDSQRSYARQEADHLQASAKTNLRWQDRVRLVPGIAPVLMFFYVYLARGGVLDGMPGFYYALQRAYAELLLSVELVDRKLRRQPCGTRL